MKPSKRLNSFPGTAARAIRSPWAAVLAPALLLARGATTPCAPHGACTRSPRVTRSMCPLPMVHSCTNEQIEFLIDHSTKLSVAEGETIIQQVRGQRRPPRLPSASEC